MLSSALFLPFHNHFCSAKGTLILWNVKIHYTCIFFYLSPVLTPLPPPPNTVLRMLELSLSQFCKIGSRVRDKVSPGSKTKHPSGIAVSGFLLSGLWQEPCKVSGTFCSNMHLPLTASIAPLYLESWGPLKKGLSLSLENAVPRCHRWHNKLQVSFWVEYVADLNLNLAT